MLNVVIVGFKDGLVLKRRNSRLAKTRVVTNGPTLNGKFRNDTVKNAIPLFVTIFHLVQFASLILLLQAHLTLVEV